MTPNPDPVPTLEDVLDSFSVEQTHDTATLERYLKTYPQHSSELLDVAFSFMQPAVKETAPVTETEKAQIEAARKEFARALDQKNRAQIDVSARATLDLLSVSDQKRIADVLGVKRSLVLALKHRRARVETVPRHLFFRIAEVMRTTAEKLYEEYCTPFSLNAAASYKSDEIPEESEPISFSELLAELQIPAEKTEELLREA